MAETCSSVDGIHGAIKKEASCMHDRSIACIHIVFIYAFSIMHAGMLALIHTACFLPHGAGSRG